MQNRGRTAYSPDDSGFDALVLAEDVLAVGAGGEVGGALVLVGPAAADPEGVAVQLVDAEAGLALRGFRDALDNLVVDGGRLLAGVEGVGAGGLHLAVLLEFPGAVRLEDVAEVLEIVALGLQAVGLDGEHLPGAGELLQLLLDVSFLVSGCGDGEAGQEGEGERSQDAHCHWAPPHGTSVTPRLPPPARLLTTPGSARGGIVRAARSNPEGITARSLVCSGLCDAGTLRQGRQYAQT